MKIDKRASEIIRFAIFAIYGQQLNVHVKESKKKCLVI